MKLTKKVQIIVLYQLAVLSSCLCGWFIVKSEYE